MSPPHSLFARKQAASTHSLGSGHERGGGRVDLQKTLQAARVVAEDALLVHVPHAHHAFLELVAAPRTQLHLSVQALAELADVALFLEAADRQE